MYSLIPELVKHLDIKDLDDEVNYFYNLMKMRSMIGLIMILLNELLESSEYQISLEKKKI